ncbi:MAG TPA: cellulase family glycosylhydrolase [Pyrinomonadaceae bacterium]|jgi:hypothetical protein|nr:cellulase family glycosylhydrolase [Pyrinomonadaceae bacterium]
MLLRFLLVVASLVLSLAISSDNRSTSCAGCWLAVSDAPTVEQSLGVNIHFIDPKPGEVKMIADAGFRWVRMDFVWEDTERQREQYDFSAYDRLLKQLDEYQIRALFILDYGNPLYTQGKSVRTPLAREAFARWAVAAGKHFSGRGIIWELFNEPNNRMFWPPVPNVEEYNALAEIVGQAFHAELPNEQLIGPAMASTDLRFLQSCLSDRAHHYWSAISIHPYRQTNPETAGNDYARLRELLDQIGSTQSHLKIISSEWGYSSAWSRMNEERQATTLTREFLTNLANGISLSIWYDWRDDGNDATEPEDHFGLVRYDYHANGSPVYEPKPAFLAAKTLTTLLSGYRFEQRLSVGTQDDYVLTFRRAGERRVVAWTTGTPHRLTIPEAVEQYSIITMTGVDGGQVQSSHGVTIDVSTTPVYVIPTT